MTTELFAKELEALDRVNRSIAYHEGSHAVIRHRLGFKVKSVTINNNYCTYEDSAGEVALYPSQTRWLNGPFMLHRRYHRKADNFGIGLVAGVVGESKHAGVPVSELWTGTGSQDHKTAMNLAVRARKNPFVQLDDWLARAKALLDVPENWAAVERIVDLLMTDWQHDGFLQGIDLKVALG